MRLPRAAARMLLCWAALEAHQQQHATMHLPRAALRAPQQPAGHDVLQSESHAALQVLLQAMMRAAMGTRGA